MKLARIKPITDPVRQMALAIAYDAYVGREGDLDDPYDYRNIGTGRFYLDPNYRGR